MRTRMEDAERWGQWGRTLRGSWEVGKVRWFRGLISALIAPPILEFLNLLLMDFSQIIEHTDRLLRRASRDQSLRGSSLSNTHHIWGKWGFLTGEKSDGKCISHKSVLKGISDLEVEGRLKFIWFELFLCSIVASSTKENRHSHSFDGTQQVHSALHQEYYFQLFFVTHCVREMLTQQFEAVFYDAVEFYCIVLKGGSNAKGQDSHKSHSTRVMSEGDFFLMHL